LLDKKFKFATFRNLSKINKDFKEQGFMNRLKIYFLYFTVFVTGAAILIIEILGTRVITPFFGSTIFVWSSLIVITLSFLALGYWIGGMIVDRRPNYIFLYGIIFLAGLFTSTVMKIDQPVLIFADRFGLRFGPLIATFFLFSLPIFLLGMVTPFAIRLQAQTLNEIGKTSGGIFAFATIGSLIGAFLAGFLLVPILSINRIFQILSLFLILLGLTGLVLFKSFKNSFLLFLLLLIVAIIITGVPRINVISEKAAKILYEEQSFYGNLKIVQIAGQKCLVVDSGLQTCRNSQTNSPEGPFIDQSKKILESLLPSQKMLLLGLGGGSLALFIPPGVKADLVEIDPKIVKLAQDYFFWKPNKDQKVYIDDARHFLRKTNKKYDLIFSDLAVGMGIALPAHLHTQEAINLIKKKLTKTGFAVFHFKGKTDGTDPFVNTLITTILSVFPNTFISSLDKEENIDFLVLAFNNEDFIPYFLKNKFPFWKAKNFNAEITRDQKHNYDFLILPALEDYRTQIKKYYLNLLFIDQFK
jgi:predicted membrane-bound spermidine synthase